MAYVTVPAFGNWLSDIAGAVIPKKTIVGKLLAGNTQGALAAIQGSVAAPVAKPVPTPIASPFAPGGWVDRNSTLLLGGAAALAAVLVLKRRSARR